MLSGAKHPIPLYCRVLRFFIKFSEKSHYAV